MLQKTKALLLVSAILLLTAIYFFFNINKSQNKITKNENIIPREVLFGTAKISNVRISPDGNFVSYLTPAQDLNGMANIVIAPTREHNKTTILTNERSNNIQSHIWAFNNTHLLYVMDDDGDENYHIYSANIASKEKKDLTPFHGVNAKLLKASYKYPNTVIIGLNKRNPEFFDLYKVNIETGEMSLLLENNRYLDFTIDDDLKVRFGNRPTDNGTFIVEDISKLETQQSENQTNRTKSELQEDLDRILEIKPEELHATYIIDFNKDRKKVYISDSRNSDTAGLFLLDLQTKKTEEIYLNDEVDIEKVIIHQREKIPEIVFYSTKKGQYKILNKNLQEDFYILTRAELNKEIHVIDRSLNDDLWIIAYSSDTSPTSYYLYNRLTKEKVFLFTNNPNLVHYKLAPMYQITIEARDGLKLPSYLTLPLARIKKDALHKIEFEPFSISQTNKLTPLIVLVHGGPIHRDHWEMNPIHQWAASRGYAVLSVNYRGSSGFGKKFLRAGFGEWGEKMHTDILDATEWAVNNNIASKDQIAIIGASYGGYEALTALTKSSDTFNCAVDIVGPTDLVTLSKTIPPYWKPMKALLTKMLGGDSENDAGKKILLKKSPISHIDQIKKPLLIAHGANDPRVRESQVSTMVKYITKKNVPVIYLLYSDGHQLNKPNNRISLFSIIEYFLVHNLKGGIVEDISDITSLQKSSMQIKEGANILSKYSSKLTEY